MSLEEEGIGAAEEVINQEDQAVDLEANQEEQEGDEGEVVITIGDESPPAEEDSAPAPEWVKEVRRTNRELQRKNRELEAKLQEKTQDAPGQVVLGKKPSLESCEYDAERYENELESWHDRKRQADEQEAKANAAVEEANKAWQSRLENYNQAKAALKVRDYAEAEDVVREALSPLQQSAIIKLAKKPELVIYALGSRPEKAKELAAITDPAEYIYALATLEKDLKVSNGRTPPPPPERTAARGSASISATVDSQLDRLRADAEKSGDYTKVMEYKRSKKG